MIRIFTLLAFTVLTISQGFAQNHVNYDRDTRWFIGLNVGGTWTTQTEVDYRVRGGYGLTFGKSFGMNQDKIFSWDLRARFLHAQFQGQATDRYALDSASSVGLNLYGTPTLQTYQDSLGYFIPNYRTNLLSGSIELVLNTNRLRQNTGWNLSVFGGIGIKGYHTATNLVDDDIFLNEPTYDYDQLPANPSQSNIINLQDDDYETSLVGDAFNYEVDWAPSFGFGISKQVHPAVAIGLEHKMTWTRNNLFDGMPNEFSGGTSFDNDIYHYTALTFKFHLFHGRYDEEPIVDDPDIEDFDDPVTDPIIDPVTKKLPIVDIYDPNASPHTTLENSFRIKANIYYVDSKEKVTFKQDGNSNTNFTFNPYTDQFESRVILHPGQNLFEITGTNDAGSDYESVIIIYQKEEEPKNPPIVTITNPPYTPYYTSSNIFGLVSTVLNVDRKSQIRVYLNGVNLNAFSYDGTAKVVNASLNLNEGTNTVTVTATNDVGSDSKTVEIIYRKPDAAQPPIVDFVNPGMNPHYTSISSINIRATALHVASKAGLTIRVNGNPVSSYSFNTSTKEIYFSTALIVGANIVEITGVNEAGSDFASTTIIYSRPDAPQPPIVTFIDPATDPIIVYTPSYNVTAKVEHVASAGNITLKINGVVSTLFSYSVSSDMMNFTTSLVEGSNVIEIKGVNTDGMDVETTTIIYRRSIPQAPPIVDITYTAVDNIEFESPNITVVANVLNVASAADINVSVNGVPTGAFTYNTYTKVLNLPIMMNEGSNIVSISGTNVAGTDSDMRIIKYKKPVVPCPPTVNFINPPTSPHLSEVAAFTVTANTTHIDSKGQIVFKQNGVLISDAAYAFIGGNQIVYNATLISGSNIFEVSVENADGSDSDLAVINYEKDDVPCLIPTVGYISPVPYSTVEEPNVTIDAQINNHSPGTTVELRLNGVSQGYMVYNGETSIASKAITLLEGSNAVNVIVTNECGTNQATFTLIYEAPDAPCYDPTLTAAGETSFTTLAEVVSVVAIATHVANADELTIKLNGSDIPFAFDAGTGTITIADVNLLIGSNAVSITATTDCGSAVLVYNIIREECKVPVISGVTPINGTATEAESIVVNATISNAITSDIVLILNGVSHEFSYNEGTDILTEALNLNVGSNSIEIRVENACGVDIHKVAVLREVPCETIVTSLLSPASNTVTAPTDSYSVTLHASGVESADQITATLNGASVTPSFDLISGNIVLSGLSLENGENTVVVAMSNGCSESTVTYTINYVGCEPPVIIINSIYPGMVVTEGIFNLAVIVTNVSDASDIVLLVNGLPADFDFEPVTHLLTAEFPLLDGSNRVDIQANGCETVSADASLTYETPCDKISHTLMSPSVIPTVSVESDYEITLSTFGVDNAGQIMVKLNGTAIPFMFNPESKIITISSITLIDGTNNVIVNLENDCSSDVVNYSITYNGCDPPVITLGANPSAVTESLYNFQANVSNVGISGAIQVLLNDAPVPFIFDPVSGGVNANMTLAEGSNTIRITANGCESASKAFTVNYTIPCTPVSYTLGSPSSLSAESAEGTYNINLVVQHVNTGGINVTNGGLPIPFTLSGSILSINGINLKDGANTIVVRLVNPCSNETITYTITHDDCSTPSVNLSANPLTAGAPIYNFVGTVTNIDAKAQLLLTLNGTVKPFAYDAGSGTVTAMLSLNEGVNTIELTANGCETAKNKIQVRYTLPCASVSYSLVSPSTLVSSTEEESIALSLNTANVSEETISATLNGSAIAHTFAGGVIAIGSIPLAEGSNTVAITFGNECSSETVTYTIDHDHCDIPEIIINGLTDGMVLVEQDLVFFATILNIEDPGDIILRFNGVAVPFEYDMGMQQLEAPLVLNDGSNEIEIIVNGCERVTGGVDVVYDAPCAPPTYTMVSPTESVITIEGDTYTVSLNVEHVTEAQISISLNGAAIDFTYSSGTVIFEMPYISIPTNTAIVTLENDCGTTKATYVVTYILEEENCVPEVSATFSADNKSATALSDKALINVILNLHDGTTQLLTDVDGMTGTFSATGEKAGSCIVGVWIRSGCNMSAAGEPFGDYVANPGWDGVCEEPCSPITHTLITPNRLSTATTVNPYTIILGTANVEDAGDVTALVNGVSRSVSFDGTRVTLSGITLQAGSNTIQFNLSNDCSTETVTYTISLTVPGGIAPGEDDGGKTDGLGTDGVGTGGGGGTKVQEVIAPKITPVSPITTKVTVKSQTLTLKTKVTNVKSKSEIKLLVNGVNTSAFNYNSSTQQLAAVIRLNQGVNSIKVTADNGKKTSLTYYVTYKKQAAQQTGNGGNNGGTFGNQQGTSLTPKLTRMSPKISTSTTSKPTYIVKTLATNVMSKSNLTLTINGTKTTNFTFSSASKTMSATVRLREGANTIKVDAVNGNKKASTSYMITYKKPAKNLGTGTQQNNNGGGGQQVAKKPVFRNVNPASSTKTVKSPTFVLKTKITNVKSKSGITLTVNGVRMTSFTFNTISGELVSTLKLKAGSNTIRISAKNGNQVATTSYTVKYVASGGTIKPADDIKEEDKKPLGAPANKGGLKRG
ncbi:MAG: hypothetical protein ACI8ZM_001979 [Crocinitomix sp.]|jgi:hypothetical protein